MRVCHVIEAGGGVGNVVLDLIRSGLQMGDDVTLIYAPNRAWPSFTAALETLKGAKIIPLSMQREVGLHDIADCVKLFARLRRYGPFDVIHAHSSKAGALVRILRPFFSRSVVVYTPHAFMTMAPDASCIYGWIEHLLSWFCDAVICVSEQERRHALKLGISPEKLHVVLNGVRFDGFSSRLMARTKLNAGEAEFVVGFVGRLVPQKNPMRLVRAFHAAATQNPDLHLAIIGYGPLYNETQQAFEKLGLKDKVKFYEDYDARNFIPGFDCLLCTSDYESFGLVILEAMAAGVPVVTTNVGVAEEAVASGVTGFITSDFEPLPLAVSVLSIAAMDTNARGEMSRAAKERAQVFSIARMGQQTRQLYTELVER